MKMQFHQTAEDADYMTSPVIIVALGGSGTRVVARIVREAGYFIGSNLNESEDALEFVEFYDRWINRYLLRERAPLCREEEDLMNRDFLACVARHRIGIPAYGAPWGWKEPRGHFLLPSIHTQYPGMKLIHVVRDGRDMAFSENQNQLRKHGAAFLGPEVQHEPQPLRSARLWANVNLRTRAYAESRMQDSYLVVRYEDLCSKPIVIISEVLNFLGCRAADVGRIAELVIAPESIGRWQEHADVEVIRAIDDCAGNALRAFGYA